MELKTGYKQTEVGVIPSDWEVKKLGEIADVKTGPFGSSLHQKDYVEDGTPIITVEHLGEQGVVHENLPLVSDFDKKRLSSYLLQTGDIVFSRVGSVDRNSLIKESENGWLFSGRLLRIKVAPKKVNHAYLSFYFQQEPTKQRIRNAAVGQTMASLNTQILKRIEISLPGTIEEQTGIATTLSDTDQYITHIEKLIVKKRNIKQGTMQELLKPKEGWVVKKLTDIVDYIHGKAHERDIVEDGKYIVVNSKFVSTEGEIIKYSNVNNCPARKNDILTVLSDLPNGKALAKCYYIFEDDKFAVNQRICIWRTKGAKPKFLFYLLNRNKYFLALDDGLSQTHILNHHI